MCCNVLHSEAIALQRPTFLDSAIFGQARCAVTGTQMSPPEKERDVEKPFLLFMFLGKNQVQADQTKRRFTK